MKHRRSLLLLLIVLVPSLVWIGGSYWTGHLLALAEEDLQAERLDNAWHRVQSAERLWFKRPQAYLLAGRIARLRGEFDLAGQYLRKCSEARQPAEDLEIEFMLLKVHQGGLESVEQRLRSRSQGEDRAAVRILEVLTPAYIRSYRLLDANECLRRWIALEPGRSQAWQLRAQVSARLRNHDDARESYQRVVALDSGNLAARLSLGELLTEGGEPNEALQHFEYVRQRQGDSPEILVGLARCRRALNQPEEARRLLDRLVTEHPGDGSALAERGRLAMETETPEAAEQWLRKAVAAAPFEKEIVYLHYQCLLRLQKKDEAERVFTRLKQIEDDLAQIAMITRAIAQSPHDANLRYEAGTILMRNGQSAEAARWLNSALEEDPGHEPSHRALADYFEKVGDLKRAKKHRDLAAEGTAKSKAKR